MWYTPNQRLWLTIGICVLAGVQFYRGAWQSALLFLGCAALFGWSYFATRKPPQS